MVFIIFTPHPHYVYMNFPDFFVIKRNAAKISKKLKENQEHNPKHYSPKTIQKHATSSF
jgi:hypothetical protein